MTERLFLDHPTLQSMDAIVRSAGPEGIVLDQTVFYARSGGQPGDCGQLTWAGGTLTVTEAFKGDNDAVLHKPAEGSTLPEPGTAVTGTLDWPRRHALMRMHTTLHLLCATLPGVSVTGGQIGADKSRLDFDMADPPTKESLDEKLNALIAANHPVSAYWVDEAVLDANPNMVRTLSVKPPRGSGRVRLVRIGTADTLIDLQPCGGTHVVRTGEIGAVRVTKIENKGRQNRRIVVELIA